MTERTWTASELEALTPDERDRIVKEGVETDLANVPEEFVPRARSRGRELLEELGITATDGS